MGFNLGGLHIDSGGLKIDGTPIDTHPIQHQVEQVGGHAVHGIQDLVKRVGHLEDEFKQVGGQIKTEAEKVAKDVLEAFAAAALSKAAKHAAEYLEWGRDAAEVLADVSVTLGPFTLSWGTFGDKIDTVIGLLKEGVKSDKGSIINYVDLLAPDSVTVTLDAALAAVIVTSDAFSIGLSFTLSVDAALDFIREKL